MPPSEKERGGHEIARNKALCEDAWHMQALISHSMILTSCEHDTMPECVCMYSMLTSRTAGRELVVAVFADSVC